MVGMSQVQDYKVEAPEPADRVELMIHGVGGTPPESMLESGEIVRVRGDVTAAFFRTRRRDPGEQYVREAYSWGGLTAGSASRAFWVFLAPFAFLNVAGWMLPPASADGDEGSTHHAITIGVLRLIGLTVTVHAAVWIGQMSIDFAAWQCGGDVSCRSATWLISLFGMGWFDGAPGRRLVVGALVPLLAILVLYRLTRRTVDRYETVAEPALGDYKTEVKDSFADPTFWRRGGSLSSFTSLHLTGAVASLAWVLAWTFAWMQPTGSTWVQTSLGWLALGLLVVSAVSIATARAPSPRSDDRSTGHLETLVVWHRRATIATLVITLGVGVVWPGYEDPGASVSLAPYADVWRWIWIVSLVSLVAFAVLVLTHPNRTRTVTAPLSAVDSDDRVVVGFGSFGSVVAAFFGFLVAVAILGGFGAASARILGGRPTIQSTFLYDAFGLVTTGWVLLLMVVVVTMWVLRKPQLIPEDSHEPSDMENEVTAGFQEDVRSFFTGRARKRRWLISIRTARDVRSFIPVVESILGWMVIVAMLSALLLLALQQVAPDTLRSAIESVPAPLLTASAWFVAVGIPLGMIWAIRRAYGSRQARRLIGTLWDVVTFWPRWFHPLAPPSYSGRAIPELRTRIDVLVNTGSESQAKATVVVTAHSQGSVLALAAIDGFDGQDWIDHVSLLTHGSPITRLYVRLFPSHMVDPIDRVSGMLGRDRWVNVYRLTDPIGGAISGETVSASGSGTSRGAWWPGMGTTLGSGAPDRPLSFSNPVADPDLAVFSEPGPEHLYPKKGDPYPQPLGHSEYKRAPEFQRSLEALLGL